MLTIKKNNDKITDVKKKQPFLTLQLLMLVWS
nr:MAG TPA: hypothetical protein [Caudoviricetes sp.]